MSQKIGRRIVNQVEEKSEKGQIERRKGIENEPREGPVMI
jgi:hypothetical protein